MDIGYLRTGIIPKTSLEGVILIQGCRYLLAQWLICVPFLYIVNYTEENYTFCLVLNVDRLSANSAYLLVFFADSSHSLLSFVTTVRNALHCNSFLVCKSSFNNDQTSIKRGYNLDRVENITRAIFPLWVIHFLFSVLFCFV